MAFHLTSSAPEVLMDAHLLRALACIDEGARALTAEQIARPVPGRWSIAQILEHLMLAYSGSTKAVERILASGELHVTPSGPKAWLARSVVIDFGYFPRVKSPEAAQPQGLVTATLLGDAVHEALRSLDQALVLAAERFDEHTPILDHPHLAGMSVRQWRKFHWRHTAHHMKQVHERARARG